MTKGIDKLREHFAGSEEQYVIIGGTACHLLLGEAELSYRATKDIDLVLCVEVIDAAFGERIAAFLESGGYRARERSDGRREYYRFIDPSDTDYPYMVELFTRRPGALDRLETRVTARIPVDDELLSLSAILLDDAYFDTIKTHTRMVSGVPVIDERLMIPFKARAFVDLTRRRDAGNETVHGDDIKKHRNDVFRLLQLLRGDAVVDLPPSIRGDLSTFLALVEAEPGFEPRTFGVPVTTAEGAALLRSIYRLP